MRLSSKSQYGLKACFILAQNYPARCVSALFKTSTHRNPTPQTLSKRRTESICS